MVPERLAWAGGVAMSCIGIYLSFVPLAGQLGRWLVVALAGLVILAAILMFPWRRRPDGSAARLAGGLHLSGSNNRVQIAGDHANQVMGSPRIRGGIGDRDDE